MRNILVAVILSVLASVLAVKLWVMPQTGGEARKESAYERVMRTGVLRCGYWNWPPILSVDSASGQVKDGIFKDYTEALANSLNLKVEWVKEVGFATFATDIQLGIVDAVCGGVWPVASRGREMDFTMPIYYIAVKAYVRPGDMRFDHNIARVDAPDVTIAGMDGWAQTSMAAARFPRAKTVSLPDMSAAADVYQMVVGRKADIVFNDAVTSKEFLNNNPGALREVVLNEPLGMFGNTIGIGRGEYELKRMLDNATEQLIYSGLVDQIIDNHEKYKGTLLRVALPLRQGVTP